MPQISIGLTEFSMACLKGPDTMFNLCDSDQRFQYRLAKVSCVVLTRWQVNTCVVDSLMD